MPKSSRGGQGNNASQGFNTQSGQIGANGATYSPMTPQQLNNAYNAFQAKISNADINVKYAVLQYIRQDTDGNSKSPSQNMNHKLETGQKLTQNEAKMVKNLDKGMTPIGQDTVLYRADHAQDIMNKLGIKGWEKMSNAQLQAAVVGKVVTESKYLSTSTDTQSNPFITGAQAGGRSAMITFKTPGTTKAILGNPKQKEAVIARGSQWKITGVRFTGKMVYPKAGGAYPQIAFDAEFI